ncbi:hypothetical protein [Nereida ignava]|uniref:hypothetical protein n=1 Tax=Nereida ignava TaxID=282199 RepID=UPI0030F99CF7
MTTFAALDKQTAKYKQFVAAGQAAGVAATAHYQTADTTPNFYFHNTVTMAVPAASHSTIASALGTGVHGIVGLLGVAGNDDAVRTILEGGCTPVQMEAAFAVVRALDQLGYSITGSDVEVPVPVWGVRLYADLTVAGPDNTPAVCELKTVWAPAGDYNVRTDKLHTHREQAILGARGMGNHGALCLVVCIPKTETVDAITVQSLVYTKQEVATVCKSARV